MSRFAVIDTETTWGDEVMSIGTVIAESETFELIEKRYYILILPLVLYQKRRANLQENMNYLNRSGF